MALAWTGILPSNAIACRSWASSSELFAEIGLTEGGTIERVSKPLYRIVLGILRTAESAVRRLIIAAARDIVVEYKPRRPASVGSQSLRARQRHRAKPSRSANAALVQIVRPAQALSPSLQKDAPGPEPRIHVFGEPDPRAPIFRLLGQQPPTAPAPPPVPDVEETVDDGTVNARPLIRRLLAITDALQDIPRQAHAARALAGPSQRRAPS